MRWVPSPDKVDIPLSGEGKDEMYSGLGKLDWLNRRAPAVSTEMKRKNPIQMMTLTDRDGRMTPLWFRLESQRFLVFQ